MKHPNVHSNVLLSGWLYTREDETHAPAYRSKCRWSYEHLARATLTSNGYLALMHRGGDYHTWNGDGKLDEKVWFRICRLQRVDSKNFILSHIKSEGKQKFRNSIHCFHPLASVANRWIESIHLTLGVLKPRLPLSTFELSFCLLVRIVSSKGVGVPSSEQLVQLDSSEFELAKMTIVQEAITLKFGGTDDRIVVLRMKGVTVTRIKQNSEANMPQNTMVLQHEGGWYACVIKDSVQYSIAWSLITLWSWCLQPPRHHGRSRKGGKCLHGHLLLGSDPCEVKDTQVSIWPNSRIFKCTNFHGKPRVFQIFHSQQFHAQQSHKHICRVLAKPRGNKDSTKKFTILYVGMPSYSAVLKWNRYFNLPHITVLFLADVVLTELERRNCHETYFYYSQLTNVELTFDEALLLLSYSPQEIRRILRRLTEWPDERLLKLLAIVMESLQEPIISRECYKRVLMVLWEKGSKLKSAELTLRLSELTLSLTTFQLCVILRLTLHFTWCLQQRDPAIRKSDGRNKLKPFMRYWQNCLLLLTNRGSWFKGLSTEEQLRTVAVLTVFLSSYHYLIHTTMTENFRLQPGKRRDHMMHIT